MRLSLQQVTLVAIDTRAPALAAESLLRSMAQVEFGRVMLFTAGWCPQVPVPGLEVVDIAPIKSGADYSRFVLRQLPAHVKTSHVLITQWDGFVVDASAWRSEFLNYDYVGSVWPDQPEGRNVGNGGFSLRSRRMLAAGTDPRIVDEHPEDEALCRTHRSLLESERGISYAPSALARQFAYENETPTVAAFGFHGPSNLARVLDGPTLQRWLAALPDDFFRGRDARRLARALLARRMTSTAQALLLRRDSVGRREPATRLLGWWAAAQALWPSRGPGA